MSCKPIQYVNSPPEKRPLGKGSKVKAWLRTPDGVVVDPIGMKRVNGPEEYAKERLTPMLLVNSKYPGGKSLPLRRIEGIRTVAYSDYARRYFIVPIAPEDSNGNSTAWPEIRPQPIYAMDRDGNTEVIQIPKKVAWPGIFAALPTAAGLVVNIPHGRTGGGLYLFDGKQLHVIDVGQVKTFSVTADGCKIAWAIINDYFVKYPMDHRIKYINVCEGDN